MDKRKRQAVAKGKKNVEAASSTAQVAEGLKKVATSPEVQAKVKEAKEAKAEKAAKPVKEGALPPLPKMPSATRGEREKKVRPTKPCACGCGTETKSEWAPGHDARARGWALRIQRGILTIDQVPANEQVGANLMLTQAAAGTIKLVHSKKEAVAPAAAEGTGTEG